jgi:hypothetical protein
MISTKYLEGEPLRIGSEPQLLLDDALVEDRMFLARVLYKAAKYEHNPILFRDKPWEGSAVQAPLVVWDPECQRYRMWYTCCNMDSYYTGGLVYYLAHAESEDGFHWEKPLLDLFPIGPHPRTNVVYTGAHTDPGSNKRIFAPGQVFRDAEEKDPQKRFKMIGLDGRPDPKHGGAVNTEPNLICSPDGLHWTLQGTRSILDVHSDCANQVVRDPATGRWLLYCRPPMYSSGLDEHEAGRHYRRRVAVMTSKDFVHWSYPRTVLYSDEDARELPDIDHVTVFRYGSHFIMLYAAMDGNGPACWHARLASSTDGVHWERFHTREDFISSGAPLSWDAGVLPCGAPVPSGDKLLLYYTGSNMGQNEAFSTRCEPRSGGGVAIMTKGRFAAQRAGDREGYLLTREILVEGNTLRLNMAVKSAENSAFCGGRVRVAVCRHPPLGEHADYWYQERGYSYRYEGFGFDDCDHLGGDGLNIKVTWKGKDLSALQGKAAYLRFEIRNADLFSFSITKE